MSLRLIRDGQLSGDTAQTSGMTRAAAISGPLTGSQWTAPVVAALSAAILLWWRFHPLPPSADVGDDEVPDAEDHESQAQDEPEPDPLT